MYFIFYLSGTFLAHVLCPNSFHRCSSFTSHCCSFTSLPQIGSGDMRMLSTSLNVSKFSSPISTFMWPLAFVRPPPGPQVSGSKKYSGSNKIDIVWNEQERKEGSKQEGRKQGSKEGRKEARNEWISFNHIHIFALSYMIMLYIFYIWA